MNIFQKIAIFIVRLVALFFVIYGFYITGSTAFIMPSMMMKLGLEFGIFCLISGAILFVISKPIGKFIGKDLDN